MRQEGLGQTNAIGTNLLIILSLGLITSSLLIAADKKFWVDLPFPEWSAKQVNSMLSNSPWTRTQNYSPPITGSSARPGANQGGPSSRGPGGESGRGNGMPSSDQSPPHVRFRVHWFSARPNRMAFGMRALRLNPNLSMDQITPFATAPSQDAILSITIDANESGQRYARQYYGALSQLDRATVFEQTELTTKSGKRIPLSDFRADARDGTGVKFIFPRTLEDGRPMLEASDQEVRFRFVTKISQGRDTLRLNVRFKLKDMIYQGALEY